MLSDSPKPSARGQQVPRSHLLLEKIKVMLANSSAERWHQVGERLDSDRKFQRPQEIWEHSYYTETSSGVLMVRSTTPVSCKFFGGGYSFTRAGLARCVVELRPRNWRPRRVADKGEVPSTASANDDSKARVLVDGDTARAIFEEVERRMSYHQDSLRQDFRDSVQRLLANVQEQVAASAATEWRLVEGPVGYSGYTGDVNGVALTVGIQRRGSTTIYSMYCMKHGLRWDCRDSRIIKEVFELVDESVRQVSLEQLGKVLEEML
jgi:hypothetical protein